LPDFVAGQVSRTELVVSPRRRRPAGSKFFPKTDSELSILLDRKVEFPFRGGLCHRFRRIFPTGFVLMGISALKTEFLVFFWFIRRKSVGAPTPGIEVFFSRQCFLRVQWGFD